ncbi:GPBP1 protein, partial [Halcyon senegalensis]|nr:GPBP1 protein [Halcyon senegalensis]
SLQSSLNFEKHPENFSGTENCYEANQRRYNASDGFDPNIVWSNRGHYRRKEKNGWHSQGRSGMENVNCFAGHRGRVCRTYASTFHRGKGQRLHGNYGPDKETGKKEDKEVPQQFDAEDFPSLNPEYERAPNKIKSSARGVWEYPLNSRSPRILVTEKGSTKELQIDRYPAVGNLHSQPVWNGTSTSTYKGVIPKPVTPPAKPTQWKSQARGNKLGNPFPHKSAYGVENFSPFKSTAKAFTVKECNWSKSSSPDYKVSQPRSTDLTRKRTHKKSEFLKTLKQDRVEEEHEDKNHAGKEKNNLCNSNSPHHERDVNRNFENKIPQENDNASLASQHVIQSSAFPQGDVLSSFLEEEYRLLKEMGWQEDCENDETCAPLTEDEIKEFQVFLEQLQKNGLRKNVVLKNSLNCDFKFSSWKNGTFRPALENEDSETSSSDTSDDDDM